MTKGDVIVIGAGAAGLMCAITAAKRGRKVIVIESSNKPGKKILMSGGGRCNFTNQDVSPDNFISHNPHFCKSALSRYTQWDFINMVDSYNIPYYEKALGQLFCENKSNDILQMLLSECQKYLVKIVLKKQISKVEKNSKIFNIESECGQQYQAESLVIATGGLSIPTLGGTPFGYKVAEIFGIKVYPLRAGLVPFTLHDINKQKFENLSGISVDAVVSSNGQSFRENILFTHRGLSGPAILQISSYWKPGQNIHLIFNPDINLSEILLAAKEENGESHIKTVLSKYFPKRLLLAFYPTEILDKPIKQFNSKQITEISSVLQDVNIKPNGTEGYRTAEVTLGGVDCNEISSRTFEANKVPGLYFIGEVLDVTGWLGGYNFQWAWSSGWAAGQHA